MTRTLVATRCALALVSTRTTLATAAVAVLLLAAPAAQAQVGDSLTGTLATGQTNGGITSNKNPDDYYRKQALPSGLPGARSTPDRAAPADKLGTDMQPTDALFDAVNRGDIAAAREALSRGADLYAHNILGLTPVDLSVDLGHTDITFLLLSMRRAAPSPDARQPTTRTAAAPRAAVQSHTAMRAAVPRPVAPRPAPRPQVMADDSGTPRPSVGFLGFGK